MRDSDAHDREERYDASDVDTNPAARGTWTSVLVALLGLWLIVAPLLFETATVHLWNGVVIGAALVVLGGYNYYRRANERIASVSVSVFVALLGLWLIAAPFVYGTDAGATGVAGLSFWNDIVVGLLVVILGVYSAYDTLDTDVARPTAR